MFLKVSINNLNTVLPVIHMSALEIPDMPHDVFERILRHIHGDVVYARINVARFDNSSMKSQLEEMIGSQRLGEVMVDTLTLHAPSVEAVLAVYQCQLERSHYPVRVSADEAAKLATQSRVYLGEVLLRTPDETISLTPTSVKVTLGTLVVPEYVRQLRDIAARTNGLKIAVNYESTRVMRVQQ